MNKWGTKPLEGEPEEKEIMVPDRCFYCGGFCQFEEIRYDSDHSEGREYYVCLSCDRTYPEEWALIRAVKTSRRDLYCPKCGSENIKRDQPSFFANVEGEDLNLKRVFCHDCKASNWLARKTDKKTVRTMSPATGYYLSHMGTDARATLSEMGYWRPSTVKDGARGEIITPSSQTVKDDMRRLFRANKMASWHQTRDRRTAQRDEIIQSIRYPPTKPCIGELEKLADKLAGKCQGRNLDYVRIACSHIAYTIQGLGDMLPSLVDIWENNCGDPKKFAEDPLYKTKFNEETYWNNLAFVLETANPTIRNENRRGNIDTTKLYLDGMRRRYQVNHPEKTSLL
ncbi:hypothetical protein MUP77_09330 [Candidatus Bathyarchaeota archaeon]|nr:hypothetical protein [Candidatus Bathyarchaeota archaeon]